ncbi:dentin sialophosphoprotein [Arabidopsis thaliana]|nr:dentin sialophosphoprotein [Arabidopsis thaliana]ANM60544.1 dentin sialophosphoprotein [Arabidopsis thaliana]|eukprot:NP_001322824.1 dentin sialophosphoprotein [Arabidopsis thaliana]
MVEPLKETDGSSRGATKAPPSKGIALSKFLDLEIQWSALEEKSDDGQSVQKKNPLNLGGINLDDYFVERRGDLSKVEQAESKPVEDDDFKDPRSLSLFDSVKSQGVVGSQQHDNVGLFDKKDAPKSVVSSGEHENLSLFAGRDAQESVSFAAQGN